MAVTPADEWPSPCSAPGRRPCQFGRPVLLMTRSLETDYLVVGAGAMGMGVYDALIDHARDVHVTLVDRRHAAGGHWLDAYPFVQLHQASLFCVASTVLGNGAVQRGGPEAGLQERARQPEICAYYDDILYRRFLGSGRVAYLCGSEYRAEGSTHLVTSRVSGQTVQVGVRRRVVDADEILADDSRATTPPPFHVDDDARIAPVNELAKVDRGAEQLRNGRFRQDRNRRDRVASAQRGAAGAHRLGAPARAVDAQSRRGSARSGGGARARRGHHGGGRLGPSCSTIYSCASRPPA